MCAARREYTTLPAKCPSCGDEVFVQVDGEGNSVLLDEVGPRRHLHPCAPEHPLDRCAPSPALEARPSTARTVSEAGGDIRRFELADAAEGDLERVGQVRDVHRGRSLAALARPGTLEYESLFEALPSARFTQFTLVDGTHVSYTLWIPSGMGEVREGTVIRARFRAHHVLGRSFLAVKAISRP